MEEDKISVIMTVYKESKEELKESFESIINQTYKNIEFIIVIDIQKEQWRIDFIKSYNDSRVKLVVNKENLGLPLSLNKALKLVTGNYIARMDADDISILDRLEKQLTYLKNSDCDLVGCYMQYFYDNENQQLAKYPTKSENVTKLLKYKSCILHPTWLSKPEVFFEINGYRNIFACEDYDFLLRANMVGFKLGNVPEVLYKCRLSPNSISRSNSGKQELISKYIRKKYRKGKIASKEEIDEFINSKVFTQKLKKYNSYCKIKDLRARCRSNKFPMFYIYSILLLFNINHSIYDINRKIYNKYILYKDSKG